MNHILLLKHLGVILHLHSILHSKCGDVVLWCLSSQLYWGFFTGSIGVSGNDTVSGRVMTLQTRSLVWRLRSSTVKPVCWRLQPHSLSNDALLGILVLADGLLWGYGGVSIFCKVFNYQLLAGGVESWLDSGRPELKAIAVFLERVCVCISSVFITILQLYDCGA